MRIREIVCDSCKQQKNKLYNHKSALLQVQLKMCQNCINNNFEPKHIVMIYLATNGIDDTVRPYLENDGYLGAKITESDLEQFDK